MALGSMISSISNYFSPHQTAGSQTDNKTSKAAAPGRGRLLGFQCSARAQEGRFHAQRRAQRRALQKLPQHLREGQRHRPFDLPLKINVPVIFLSAF